MLTPFYQVIILLIENMVQIVGLLRPYRRLGAENVVMIVLAVARLVDLMRTSYLRQTNMQSLYIDMQQACMHLGFLAICGHYD